ncbi:MAG: PD-(D/E)XK nuclease family protein, partial [Eubacteriales bacterium]|nr:PD-(D/E)XK nuclease family protein [Eubacteriales bacterium]
MHNDNEKISANEINKYSFCPYQWYYERLYGAKYIREKQKERNQALGLKDKTLSNFNKGIK